MLREGAQRLAVAIADGKPVPDGRIAHVEVSDNSIGFAGYEFEPTTHQWMVRHRVLDSTLGRWLSRDPIGYVDGMSLYGYARSAPWARTDSFGLDSDKRFIEQVDAQARHITRLAIEGKIEFARASEMLEALRLGGVARFSGRAAFAETRDETVQDTGVVASSFIPGVGEPMDYAVATDEFAPLSDRVLAGASLTASLFTFGLAPNFAAAKRLAKAGRAAEHVADHERSLARGFEALQGLKRSAAECNVRSANRIPASSVNAGAALSSKMRALQSAQRNAVRTRVLPDGRIRYYERERAARVPGPTRGNAYVTEWHSFTGRVRAWMESYDHAGNVTRVHPKMNNGQQVSGPHYPPTGKELGA